MGSLCSLLGHPGNQAELLTSPPALPPLCFSAQSNRGLHHHRDPVGSPGKAQPAGSTGRSGQRGARWEPQCVHTETRHLSWRPSAGIRSPEAQKGKVEEGLGKPLAQPAQKLKPSGSKGPSTSRSSSWQSWTQARPPGSCAVVSAQLRGRRRGKGLGVRRGDRKAGRTQGAAAASKQRGEWCGGRAVLGSHAWLSVRWGLEGEGRSYMGCLFQGQGAPRPTALSQQRLPSKAPSQAPEEPVTYLMCLALL